MGAICPPVTADVCVYIYTHSYIYVRFSCHLPGFRDSSTVHDKTQVSESSHLPQSTITSMYIQSVFLKWFPKYNCYFQPLGVAGFINTTSLLHNSPYCYCESSSKGQIFFFQGAIGVLFGNVLLDKEMFRIIEGKGSQKQVKEVLKYSLKELNLSVFIQQRQK